MGRQAPLLRVKGEKSRDVLRLEANKTGKRADFVVLAQDPPAPAAKIDFEKLAKQFETSRKRTEAEKLQALIAKKLGDLLRANRSRVKSHAGAPLALFPTRMLVRQH